MKFLSFGEMCISPVTSIFQIELSGKQENPLSRGIRNFPGRTFLLSGGNLTRRDFEHLSLFQSYKQDSVNIEHQLKSKLAWLLCTKAKFWLIWGLPFSAS